MNTIAEDTKLLFQGKVLEYKDVIQFYDQDSEKNV